jgi:putative transcriptional regulator
MSAAGVCFRCARVLAAAGALLLSPIAADAAPPEPSPAAGFFLVAARDMVDPNFSETVILLLRYDDDGAMGLIVNRPTVTLPEQVIPDIEGLGRYAGPLFLGGPVQVHFVTFLVRGTAELEGSTEVLPDVRYSTDPDLLAELTSEATDATSLRVYAGYAGWAPGQLEHEIERGGWHVLPGDSAAVFSGEPAAVWRELAPLPEPLSASNVGRAAVTLRSP